MGVAEEEDVVCEGCVALGAEGIGIAAAVDSNRAIDRESLSPMVVDEAMLDEESVAGPAEAVILADGFALELLCGTLEMPRGILPAEVHRENEIVRIEIGAFRAKHGRALSREDSPLRPAMFGRQQPQQHNDRREELEK